MNLDDMSFHELQDLQKKVAKAIGTYKDRMKREILAELHEKAQQIGLTIEELVGSVPENAAKATVAPKYRHPENHDLTWSGRGRKPAWFKTALESGISEEKLLIR